MAGESRITTDHKAIKKWAEARSGAPTLIKHAKDGDDRERLWIEFPGYDSAEALEPISWGEFFKQFERQHLAFMYQEKISSGEMSLFFKLVSRDGSDEKGTLTDTKPPKPEEKPQKLDGKVPKAEEKATEKPHKGGHKSQKATRK